MSEASSAKSAYINASGIVLAAVIGIIGGIFLKDPVQKAFKPHCKVSGVWKPHGDLMTHCNVNQTKTKFYLRLQSQLIGVTWVVSGEGTMEGEEGGFEGTILYIPENKPGDIAVDPYKRNVTGLITLQGCDGLGVTLLDKEDKKHIYTFAFIREHLEMKGSPEEK